MIQVKPNNLPSDLNLVKKQFQRKLLQQLLPQKIMNEGVKEHFVKLPNQDPL